MLRRRTSDLIMKTTRLQATLDEVEPAVVRVIDVPADTRLPELHDLLQAGFGWWDYHLHQFVTADGPTYGMDLPGEELWPPDQIDETTASLPDLGRQFSYVYDFGDDWHHTITVLGPGGTEPGCVDGQGACPPEDCGGPGGYAKLLATLADPSDDEHEHMVDWVGGRLQPFHREQVDAYIKRMAGRVPATVRLLLDLTAGGVRLTPAGRLPRSLVRAVQQEYPGWHLTGKLAATEDDLWPLAELHALLRRVGLLRLRHNLVTPTKATANDHQIVRRLRADFAPDTFPTQLAETTTALLASHGPQPHQHLGSLVLPQLGEYWAIDGRAITERDVQHAIHVAAARMQALDLLDATGPTWSAGPSAETLLPGATLRAHVWSTHTTDTG